jgi:hypothetical protein
MAIVVIFGLMVATFLTLVVVPCLYSLFATINEGAGKMVRKIRQLYWKPFDQPSSL